VSLEKTPEQRDAALAEMLSRFLGAKVMEAVADDDVTEIYCNADGVVWLDTRSRGRVKSGIELKAAYVEQFLNSVATSVKSTITALNPRLQAELPKKFFRGGRLQGFVAPLVAGPSFNLRKPPTAIYTLEQYVESGILSQAYYGVLRYAVKEHWNTIVVGATASGKTTFCNALIHEMVKQYPQERFVILEDTVELQCAAEDVLQLKTPPDWSLADLVKLTLRASPDRIIVGEVRDSSALHLADAWSTGHPGGCATVHASTPEGALSRLDRLAQQGVISGVSQAPLIADAVDLICMLKKLPEGRRVTDLVRVKALDEEGKYVLNRLEMK
jgi:type IV secretion system protein TrbB